MRIAGFDAVAMVHHHLAPIPIPEPGQLYNPIGSHTHRRAGGCGYVDALVELALAISLDRVLTLTEAAGNWPHHRPKRRSIQSHPQVFPHP